MSSLSMIAHIDCIAIEGADARRFAQAQFSGDVGTLVPGRWQWNAWLTAQGRVQALMHLVDAGDGRLLAVLRGGDTQAAVAGLSRYLLRTRASLSILAFTGHAGGPMAMGCVQASSGSIVLGFGSRSLWLGPRDVDGIDQDARSAWRLADIRAGWPNLPQDGQPRFLPQALGMECLGAMSFSKGCYPGQEIAARLHYRGGFKRQLSHLLSTTLLPLGEVRAPDGTLQAFVLDAIPAAADCEALAVIPEIKSSKINILDSICTINTKFIS